MLPRDRKSHEVEGALDNKAGVDMLCLGTPWGFVTSKGNVKFHA